VSACRPDEIPVTANEFGERFPIALDASAQEIAVARTQVGL
jgi:hypothetical protein